MSDQTFIFTPERYHSLTFPKTCKFQVRTASVESVEPTYDVYGYKMPAYAKLTTEVETEMGDCFQVRFYHPDTLGHNKTEQFLASIGVNTLRPIQLPVSDLVGATGNCIVRLDQYRRPYISEWLRPSNAQKPCNSES